MKHYIAFLEKKGLQKLGYGEWKKTTYDQKNKNIPPFSKKYG